MKPIVRYSIVRKLLRHSSASCVRLQKAPFSSKDDDKRNRLEFENPLTRTFRVLGDDMTNLRHKFFGALKSREENDPDIRDPNVLTRYDQWQSHCDIVIIGGGVVGASIAYWIQQRVPKAVNVVVLEKDPTYTKAATTLSCGGLRQQFSLKENIEMSQYGAQFLREMSKRLGVDGHDPPDCQFTPQGYLFLASQSGADQLHQNYELQADMGVRNELLTNKQLKERFPWLNVEDVALGCLGLENEGWFDPWSLLDALKKKSISLGTKFVHGEAVGFEFKEQPDMFMDGIEPGSYEALDRIVVRRPDGELDGLKFGIAVLACGANSGEIAKLARIGSGRGMLRVPLPVEPRKRFVYCIHTPDGPGLDLPFLIDHTGTYIRREGLAGNYICGRSPPEDTPEPSTEDFEVDHDFFENHVWPQLAHRVPKLQAVRVRSAWAGHYDYNYFDQNAIVGPHPYYNNLYVATGFSGHGLQQAPAVGRAVMEMILDGGFQTIDLSRFSFDRLLLGNKVLESNIV